MFDTDVQRTYVQRINVHFFVRFSRHDENLCTARGAGVCIPPPVPLPDTTVRLLQAGKIVIAGCERRTDAVFVALASCNVPLCPGKRHNGSAN